MKVWVVTETNWSCDLDGNEERSVEVISVHDSEFKAQEKCEMMRAERRHWFGKWQYGYEEFEVK